MENIRIQMMLKAKPLIEPGHDVFGIFDKNQRSFHITHKMQRIMHIALSGPFIPISITHFTIARLILVNTINKYKNI